MNVFYVSIDPPIAFKRKGNTPVGKQPRDGELARASTIVYFSGLKSDWGHKTPLCCDIANQGDHWP